MRYNTQYIHVEHFLRGKVHNKAYNRYIRKQQGDVQQAKELQDFFRALKDVAAGKSAKSNVINEYLLTELLEEVNRILQSKGFRSGVKSSTQSNMLLNGLFRRAGSSYAQGTRFEQELESIIMAVINKAFAGAVDASAFDIGTGKKTGTTTMSKSMEVVFAEKIKEGFSKEEAIKMIDTSHEKIYQKRVQIKTDIEAPTVQIQAISKWEKIWKLLEGVTISAKSYRTHSWSIEEKVWKLKELYPTIHLGKAVDPYRAIHGTLSDLGYNQKTIESAYCAGREEIKKNNQSVINHMYHLKYIYELTGAGTKILGDSYNNVRFLVYNDPTSDNIYVQSAAAILSEIFDDSFNWSGNPLSAITISAQKFD